MRITRDFFVDFRKRLNSLTCRYLRVDIVSSSSFFFNNINNNTWWNLTPDYLFDKNRRIFTIKFQFLMNRTQQKNLRPDNKLHLDQPEQYRTLPSQNRYFKLGNIMVLERYFSYLFGNGGWVNSIRQKLWNRVAHFLWFFKKGANMHFMISWWGHRLFNPRITKRGCWTPLTIFSGRSKTLRKVTKGV